MQNHTSCTHKCVASPLDCDLAVQDWDENECACKCRYLEGPPKELACKKGFRYEPQHLNNQNESLKTMFFPIQKGFVRVSISRKTYVMHVHILFKAGIVLDDESRQLD